MSTIDALDFADLRALPGTTVTTPGDAGWDAARLGFNLALASDPVCVVSPSTSDEVATVLAFAADRGLRVAPQRTGHGAGGLAPLAGTILLRTDRLTETTVDVERRSARAGAGAVWADVCGPAGAAGLWPLAGSSQTVGVVGYTLGGGLSFLSRTHGLACNSVTAVELVTPDGRLVRADAVHEPELFWAVRGGACPGVVTAIEFDLYPVPALTAGHLFFPAERGAEVLGRWSELTAGYPDALATIGRMLQFPPLPEVPEPMRGQAFAFIEVAFLGDVAELAPYLEPLRALGPVIDTVAPAPVQALGEIHMDPVDPMPFKGGAHALVDQLPQDAIDAFAACGQAGSPLVMLELRHLGGALSRTAEGHGALGSLRGTYAAFGGGMAITPEMAGAVEDQLARVSRALEPYRAGRYANFTEEPGLTASFHRAEVRARLSAVVDAFDPAGVIVANHPVAPSEG